MSDPQLVSVITPAFNAAGLIAETIASVQAQTYRNWEMLVVDDCSSDATAEVVRGFAAKDSRISLISLSQNAGPAGARNAALEKAQGRFLAFLDCDDLWLPEKLQQQLAFMHQQESGFSFTGFRRISHDGLRTGRFLSCPPIMTYEKLLKNTAIHTLTVILDRTKTGDPRMTDAGYDDFILWLQLLKGGLVAHGLAEDLARYRVVRGSVSSKPLRSAFWVWRVYRDVEKMGPFASAYCLAHYGARAVFKRLRF